MWIVAWRNAGRMNPVTLVLTVFSVLFTTAAGWSTIELGVPGPHALRLSEKIALGWLFGAGLTAFLTHFSYALFGHLLPWILILPVVPVLIVSVRLVIARPSLPHVVLNPPHPNLRNIAILALLAVIIWQATYVLTTSMITGLRWDGLVEWAFRAKAIYLDATVLPGSLLDNYNSIPAQPTHPMGLSALDAFIYLWLGAVNEQAIKIISPVFFLSALLLLRGHLLHYLSPPVTLTLVALLATAPWFAELATAGIADVPMAAFCAGAAAFGARYLLSRTQSSEYIALALGGFMTLFKREGVILACLFIGAMCIALYLSSGIRNAAGFLFKALIVLLILDAPWVAIQVSVKIANADMLPISLELFLQNAYRILVTVGYLLKEFFDQGGHDWGSLGLIWPAALIIAIVRWRQCKRSEVAFLALWCLGYMVFVNCIFVFEKDSYLFHVQHTLDRLIAHTTPVAVLAIGHLLRADHQARSAVLAQTPYAN